MDSAPPKVDGAVVVGIDYSDDSRRAAAWAAAHAALQQRPLVLVHSVPPSIPYWPSAAAIDIVDLRDQIEEEALEMLEGLRTTLEEEQPGIGISVHVVEGDPRDVLGECSETAALVVVGARGLGVVRRALLGSISLNLTRHARGPVVIVRPHAEIPSGRGVLVGIDGTERSAAALERGFQLASWQRAPLTVAFCSWDAVGLAAEAGYAVPENHSDQELEALVSQATAGLRETYPDVQVDVQITHGPAERDLVRLAEAKDVVVVGAPTHSRLAEVFLGSVASSVAGRAKCAVAVVPTPRD